MPFWTAFSAVQENCSLTFALPSPIQLLTPILMNTSLTPSITRFNTRFALVAICILLLSAQAWAANFTSGATGNWSSVSTWTIRSGQNYVPATSIPGSGDNVIIRAGDIVTITAPAAVASLTVTGGMIVNIPGGTFTTTSVAANPSTTTGTVDVLAGNLRVENIFNLTNVLYTINGGSSSVTFGGAEDFVRTTEYFHVNNGGKLILENIGKGKNPKRQYDSGMGLGNVLFPVGTTNGTSYSYTPVYINNRDQRQATVNATFAVTVTDGVYSGGSDGTKYGFNAVNKTWSVSVLFGDADAEIYMDWNQTDELTSFDPANSMVALFEPNVWDLRTPTYLNAPSRIASIGGLPSLTNIPNPVVTGVPSPAKTFPLMSIQGTGLNPLPVELMAFNAVKKNNDVALTWETASEKNCKGFEIQSSADGKNYEALDFVASQNGNTSYSQRYAYTDRIVKKEGLMYYRLKQIDLDGTVAYSQAKVVDLGRFNYTASVYPNPFQDAFKVNLETQTAQTAEVLVTDITGKTLYNTEISLAKGNNTLDISLSNQTPGLYLLKVTTGTQTYINRLVKQ